MVGMALSEFVGNDDGSKCLDRWQRIMKWEDLWDWGFLLLILSALMLFAYLAEGCR